MSTLSRAFTFPEVRVVEASAGSGKTYALAKRYVQLLLSAPAIGDGVPLRNILAITFTNKAAFEMKARILEFLKLIALGRLKDFQEKDLLEPLGLTAQTARPRAFLVMETIIHHFNFFQVQTIDKFINSLLSGCAFKIGLTANFQIRTDSFEYLQYSLDRLIDKISIDKDVRESFRLFLHNYLYLENRSSWFPRDDIMSIITTLYHQNNAYGLSLRAGMASPEDVVRLKGLILSEMRALQELLPAETHAGFRKSLIQFLSARDKSFDIDSVSDYFAREDFPVIKGAVIPGPVQDLWTRIQNHLRQLCEREAVSLFNPYISIYHQILDGFEDLSSRDDVLFLEQLNRRAAALFDEDYVTVEELYYRLATRFQHYLVDEFQDTSRLQWRNLAKMTEEALSTGGSLFYVGDRKQAIYGFRGGDVSLFDQIKKDFQPFNVRVEPLTNNWRSEKMIVEFNNAVFSMDNLRDFLSRKLQREQDKKKKNFVEWQAADFAELEAVFHNAPQTFQPDHGQGCVRVEYVDLSVKEKRDEYIRARVLERIGELKDRFAFKEIAILTRSNTQVEQLTGWLLEAGVPVASERTSNIREQPLIRELLAFLRFLHSPVDNLAFASVLTGELFAACSGFSSVEMHDFIFSQRERLRAEKDVYLYMVFREAYPEIWRNFLEPFFRNVGHYPLYEMAVSIYHRWNCLALFPGAQGFLMRFLELVKSKEDDYGDIGAFLDFFEKLQGPELYVYAADQDAVRVLTVHKSKGLEFPAVIIPFLGMEIQVGASSADNKQSYVIEESGGAMELLRLKENYYRYSETLYRVYRRHYIAALLSELNTIYVALTRPQKELYVFIPQRVKNSFNAARFLIPENVYALGEPGCYPVEQVWVPSGEARPLPSARYHDWLEYLNDEFLAEDDLGYRERRQRGETLHLCLAQLEHLPDEPVALTAAHLIEVARSRGARIEPGDDCQSRLEALLRSPVVRRLLAVEQATVKIELEIVNRQGHTLRPDRLVILDGEVWVVDYKSSVDLSGDATRQVREYMALVGDLYPGLQVKGFLVYMDTVSVQEV